MGEKLNLFEKIQAVGAEIRNLEKNIEVGTGSYKYNATSDLDVTLAVKDAEKKYRLVSIPVKQELVSSESIKLIKKNGDEGLTHVDNIKMTVRIIDLDDINSIIEVESFGKGIDTGDKGFGKASTYARKYALLNAYKIATGEDPDGEKSGEIITPSTPNEKKTAIRNYLDKNFEVEQKLLEHYGVNRFEELNNKRIETIYSTYHKKGLL